MVEKAADGLIVEGKLASKKREGEWMSKQLIKVKNGTIEEIWPVIAHLYSMNSFLYKKMNEWMRLTEEKEHAQLVQSKILTFGPFAYLLQIISPHDRRSMIVYRGAQLSDEMIQQYKKIAGTDQRLQFQAFTSTSRNQEAAEMFGNVLFKIDTTDYGGNDISKSRRGRNSTLTWLYVFSFLM
jgi:hypothetical protein